tara:strand:- start:1015 stop:1362 length:348 start_codon:yes stop_codon:yes gene_type:complete
MKITILALLLSLNLFGQVKFPAVDKTAHFGVGYVLGTTVSLGLRAKGMPIHKTIVWGIGTSLVAGFAKEIYDKKRGYLFDDEDLMSTVFGGFIGSATVAICFGEIEFKQFKKYKL